MRLFADSFIRFGVEYGFKVVIIGWNLGAQLRLFALESCLNFEQCVIRHAVAR